jgi:hypothetical protein
MGGYVRDEMGGGGDMKLKQASEGQRGGSEGDDDVISRFTRFTY